MVHYQHYSNNLFRMGIEEPNNSQERSLQSNTRRETQESERMLIENVRRVMGECAQKIADSTLPEMHKQVISGDLKRMEDAYLTEASWGVYPRSVTRIEKSKRIDAGRALWAGK